MNAEATVRQTIEDHLADWDKAYTEKDPYGYLGHCTPDDTGEQERVFLFYRQLMPLCDALESSSIIQKFVLEGNQAKVTIQVDQKMVMKKPESSFPPFHKFVIGCMARFIFVSREIRQLIWVNTPEGWLCKADDTVSNRVRLRRKPVV